MNTMTIRKQRSVYRYIQRNNSKKGKQILCALKKKAIAKIKTQVASEIVRTPFHLTRKPHMKTTSRNPRTNAAAKRTTQAGNIEGRM